MVKEWNNEIVMEFENGFKVVIPFVKGMTRPITVKPKIDVVGPNGEYLTGNFISENFGKGLSADDIVSILAKVKELNKTEPLDIL
jgi:hypothetical protein